MSGAARDALAGGGLPPRPFTSPVEVLSKDDHEFIENLGKRLAVATGLSGFIGAYGPYFYITRYSPARRKLPWMMLGSTLSIFTSWQIVMVSQVEKVMQVRDHVAEAVQKHKEMNAKYGPPPDEIADLIKPKDVPIDDYARVAKLMPPPPSFGQQFPGLGQQPPPRSDSGW
mmetsp:Transcript_35747/g.86047  ORF Transcript_35747/g.86047 Transcript_35747/m.86047 type:complete len:171 (-) Transcript_35747:70-582(-)